MLSDFICRWNTLSFGLCIACFSHSSTLRTTPYLLQHAEYIYRSEGFVLNVSGNSATDRQIFHFLGFSCLQHPHSIHQIVWSQILTGCIWGLGKEPAWFREQSPVCPHALPTVCVLQYGAGELSLRFNKKYPFNSLCVVPRKGFGVKPADTCINDSIVDTKIAPCSEPSFSWLWYSSKQHIPSWAHPEGCPSSLSCCLHRWSVPIDGLDCSTGCNARCTDCASRSALWLACFSPEAYCGCWFHKCTVIWQHLLKGQDEVCMFVLSHLLISTWQRYFKMLGLSNISCCSRKNCIKFLHRQC